MKNILINLTNHPSENWQPGQRKAAVGKWNVICDVPFPCVSPEWEREKIYSEAKRLVNKILAMKPEAVLCQGEMCMTAALVRMFQEKGILVYAATTDRQSAEYIKPDGTVEKRSTFHFVQFRQY